jgi:Phytanoyl-CoA dioxygenase (PhyH)
MSVRKQYQEQGYYIGRDLLPKADVQSTLHEFHTIVAQQLRRLGLPATPFDGEPSVHHDMRTLLNANLDAYLASLRLIGKLFSVQKLIMNESIVAMSRELGIELPAFQTSPVLHLMANDLKVPGGYYGFGAHQDWPALQSGLDTITTWIPFVEVDRNNFPMELIPGSHRMGFLESEQQEHIHEVAPSHYHEANFIPMEANPGDVVFMCSFTIHRSGQRGGDRVRIAVSARYENASEPTFIDRLYPFAQKRVVERDLKVKGFPTREQVLGVFDSKDHP